MMSWFKRLAAVAVALVLAGCAGAKYETLHARMPPIAEGNGRIFFYQPQPSNLAAAQQKLRVNNEVVGRNKPGSFFFVDRPAGSILITNLYWTGDGVSFMLDAGQTRYVRVMAEVYGATGAVGKLSMQLVDPPELAENEMRGLRYWGAATPERAPGL